MKKDARGQPLREGFSTGTAAAAAAAAAVTALYGLKAPPSLSVALPPFVRHQGRFWPESARRLDIAVAEARTLADGSGLASVIKDGGDDPDATHGARITVRASFAPFAEAKSPPLRVDGFGAPVFLYAGPGVGVATLPGLPLAVGEAAVNPEPRKQIAHAAREAAQAAPPRSPETPGPRKSPNRTPALHLLISVPDGEERARRTLNARLGVKGGISILGTSGIVRPYSHEAWKCALSQGLAVAKALGCREILLCTGRRSERLGLAFLPHLPERASIQAADFAAYAIREAAGHSFSRLNWLCFPGKLLKLAQGLEWTHASSGAADLDLLTRLCREAAQRAAPDKPDKPDKTDKTDDPALSAEPAVLPDLTGLPTVAGFLARLADRPELCKAVIAALADQAYGVLRHWLDEAGGREAKLFLHVFTLEGRHMLSLPQDGS